jgi:hypothetical protein
MTHMHTRQGSRIEQREDVDLLNAAASAEHLGGKCGCDEQGVVDMIIVSFSRCAA